MAKTQGNRIGLWIIVGLLFVGLIGFGSAGLQSGLRSIGSVGDKNLSVQSYEQAYNAERERYAQRTGIVLNADQARQENIPEIALNNLVQTRAIDNEAAQLGLSAGDELVLEQIMADPSFVGMSGTFERERYTYILENSGLTEEQHETTLRENVARSLLQTALVGGIPVPDVAIEARLGYLGEQRDITWATLDASSLGSDVPEPTEAEVQAHYDANPATYTTPEVRHISYAWITPDLLQDEIEIDDAMLQTLYDERRDIYIQPERRLVEELVYPSEEEANAALDLIEAGEADFDAIVAARGLSLSDVDLGDVAPEDLTDEAAEAVFAASSGDVIGPVISEFGSPAIYRMNAVLAAQVTTFDEIKDDLRAEIATSRAARMISGMNDDIADLVAGGAGIEDLVDRTDLRQGQIDWSADVTEGIAAYDAFREAAAQATEGALPEMVPLSDGGVFVLRLDGITEPALLPLDEVRDRVTQDRRDAATQEAIIETTNALITTLATQGDFEAQGLTPTRQENLTRDEFVAGAPAGFTDLIFRMEEGDVSTMETETGTLIVRVEAINPADLESEAMMAQRDVLTRLTGFALEQEVYSIFSNQLLERTDVDIDQNAVNQINAQLR